MRTNVSKLIGNAEIVAVSGPDAETFAQSQFSNDVSALAPGYWQWSAWLDPQGRVRFLFALLRPQAGKLLAWLPLGNAVDMARELSRFVLRARVNIEVLADASLVEGPTCPKERQAIITDGENWSIDLPGRSPRQVSLSCGPVQADVDPALRPEWLAADIEAGLPWVAPELAGEFTAAALGLERLGAVSLAKGCYPGQEIVARLHYRGGNKRQCMRLSVDGSELPACGEVIHAELSETPAGRILYAVRVPGTGIRALAILPADLTDGTGLRLASGARIGQLEPA